MSSQILVNFPTSILEFTGWGKNEPKTKQDFVKFVMKYVKDNNLSTSDSDNIIVAMLTAKITTDKKFAKLFKIQEGTILNCIEFQIKLEKAFDGK
jgi:chromatin remodeling complex protein RSC6